MSSRWKFLTMGQRGSTAAVRRETITGPTEDPSLRRLNQGLRDLEAELTAGSFESIPADAAALQGRSLEALSGRVRLAEPPTPKTAHITFISAWHDSHVERDVLSSKIMPFLLRWFDRNFGYDLELFDVSPDAGSTPVVDEQACAMMVERCMSSLTPIAVVFCNDTLRAGKLLPRHINKAALEQLIATLKADDAKILSSLYEEDRNVVPPAMTLKDCSEDDPRLMAASRLLAPLDTGSWRVVREIDVAMGQSQPPRVVSFSRKFSEEPPPESQSSYSPASQAESEALELVKRELSGLPKEQFGAYTVSWAQGGVDKTYREHMDYLVSLSLEFARNTMQLLGQAAAHAQQNHKHETVYFEAVSHLYFAYTESELVADCGVANAVKSYLAGAAPISPLIFHGETGSGKTCAAAVATTVAIQHTQSAVVPRFFGLTNKSSSLLGLLSSIGHHMCELHEENPSIHVPLKLSALKKSFATWLSWSSVYLPVVIIIDGIDAATDGGHPDLSWIPQQLPEHAHVIVTVQQCREWDEAAMQVARPRKIGLANDKSCVLYINKFLHVNNRLLPESQAKLVTKAYKESESAFVLRAMLEMSRYWKSLDTPVADPKDLKGAMILVAEDIESALGDTTTKLLFAALSSSRNGLSISELVLILRQAGKHLPCTVDANIFGDVKNAALAVATFYNRAGWLFNDTCDTRVLKFRHDFFKKFAIGRYASTTVDETRKALSSMFVQLSATSGVSRRVASELPWLLQKTNDLAGLRTALNSVDLFTALGNVTDDDGQSLLVKFWEESGHTVDLCARYMRTLDSRYKSYAGDPDRYRAALFRTAKQAFRVGSFLSDNGDKSLAVEFFKFTLQVRDLVFPPDHGDTLHLLDAYIASLVQLRQYKEALGLLERVATARKKTSALLELANTLSTQGIVHKELGNVDGAVKAWTKACQLFPDIEEGTVPIRLRLSEVLQETGKPKKAIPHLEIIARCLEINQRSGSRRFRVHALLASCYESLKKPKKALEQLQFAMEFAQDKGTKEVASIQKRIKIYSKQLKL